MNDSGTAAARWRKSTFSADGNCAEIGGWRKASFSDAGNCVEAGHGATVIGVRDTKQAGQSDRPVLEFPAAAWRSFIDGLRGE